MNEIFSSPFFGIALSICTFELGVLIQKKTRCTLLNPLLISVTLCILILEVFHISLKNYRVGGSVISAFLGPATAVLAISVYSQLSLLKKTYIPVIAGTVVGSAVSVSSVYFLCRVFGISDVLTKSMLTKSISTPFALAVSKDIGGICSISVAAVVLTGIFGAVSAPLMIRLFRIKNPVAQGIAIGTCSHAVGTSKAIELGEVQGAMSSIALIMTGLITVLIFCLIS